MQEACLPLSQPKPSPRWITRATHDQSNDLILNLYLIVILIKAHCTCHGRTSCKEVQITADIFKPVFVSLFINYSINLLETIRPTSANKNSTYNAEPESDLVQEWNWV